MDGLLSIGPILIVDDDTSILLFLRDYLHALGVEVMTAEDGSKALKLVHEHHPQFIILDVMMPCMDGYTACVEIRKISTAPILLLTAKVEEDDKITGLSIGADDYLTKPFSPRELVARMQAIIRRMRMDRLSKQQLVSSHLICDEQRHQFFWKGALLHFTVQEAKILQTLMESHGRICTREYLLDVLYPLGDKVVIDRIIDVHIGNIRQKIRDLDDEFDFIETVRGIGYRLKESG